MQQPKASWIRGGFYVTQQVGNRLCLDRGNPLLKARLPSGLCLLQKHQVDRANGLRFQFSVDGGSRVSFVPIHQ